MTGRIHDRYLLKQFARIFVISVVAFVTIYITVNVFEEIDNFIDHDASLKNIARYYFYSIPFILTYIVPVSLLLATIFSMGILARRNELTALIASGISLFRVSRPIVLTAILLSVASAFFNDFVVTKSVRKSEEIRSVDIEGRSPQNSSLKEGFYYLGENGFVYLARRYNVLTKTLMDVVVQKFKDNTLERRIDAKRAKWDGEHWVFHQGFDRTFSEGDEQVQGFEKLAVQDLVELPDEFAKEEIKPEHMNMIELAAHIQKIRKSGGQVERHLTDYYFKFSYPLAGPIFVLLGIAFASGKRKQSIATGFGLTLFVAFVYYGVLRTGQTLGYNGIVPPAIAAELGNLVFLVLGCGFLIRANQ